MCNVLGIGGGGYRVHGVSDGLGVVCHTLEKFTLSS